MGALGPLLAGGRKFVQRWGARLALALLGAAAALTALGFATAAALELLRARYGEIDAAAIVALFYLALAVVLFVWRGQLGPPARPLAPPLGRAAGENAAAQAAAAAKLGADVAQRLSPFQLVLAAVLAGFVAGRKT